MVERRERRTAKRAAAMALAAAALAAAAPAAAQGSVRAWGMGGAHTAAARGLDAVEWNCANLAAGGGAELGLASAAVDLANNSFTLDRYNEVTGATLDEADKERLLGDVPADGLRLAADLRASLLGLRLGGLALTVSALGGGGGTLDRDFLDLALMGNEPGQALAFDRTRGEAWAVGAVTLSAARPLWSAGGAALAAGVNLRWLRGIREAHVEAAGGSLRTDLAGVSGEAEAVWLTAEGGRGWAGDAGLMLQAPGGWTFGLAADNLAGGVTWDRGVERHVWSARADTLSLADDDLEARIADSDTSYAAGPYRTHLPRRLRLGASREAGPLLLAVDVARDLETRPATPGLTTVSAGLQWSLLSWLQPRVGASLGDPATRGGAVGLGLRLGPWRLDLAARSRGALWGADARGLALAAGSRLEF